MDGGTLQQLRNLINRRNVSLKPSSDIDAASNFLHLVGEAHIVAAATSYLNMQDLESVPEIFPTDESAVSLCDTDRRQAIMTIANNIVDQHCDFRFLLADSEEREEASSDAASDSVYEYASDVLSLSLFYMEYEDAIAEGDGLRILRCWKYLLPYFYSSNKKNYSIEALRLLLQYYYLLPPRLSQQLIWSRCINVHGRPGKNIPMDLHMEHLNRTVKTGIEALGSNVTDRAILRVGKTFRAVEAVTNAFDESTSVSQDSGKHGDRSSTGDFKKVLKQLQSSAVFNNVPGRHHRAFPKFNCNVFRSIDYHSFEQWLTRHIIDITQ